MALFIMIGVFQYVGIGMIQFGKQEGQAAMVVGVNVTAQVQEGTFHGHTFIDRLWFCFVLLTTVGYGNTFTPTSPASRNFTLVWSLYGLFLFGASSSIITSAMKTILSAIVDRLRRIPLRTRPVVVSSKTAQEKSSNQPFTPSDLYYVLRGLYIKFVVFLFINFGGAGIFWLLERDTGMTFLDAFYHCIMTATTIGLGDIAPQSQGGRLYGVLHMILSVALFGSILGTILSALDRRVQSLRKSEMLKKQLQEDLLVSLDRDGDGVDKAEFVLGMLEKLGVLSREDYEPFLEQFAELDKTGDGRLSRQDLIAIAHLNRKKANDLKSAEKSAPITYRHRIEQHARELLVPTFIACFGFLWCMTLYARGASNAPRLPFGRCRDIEPLPLPPVVRGQWDSAHRRWVAQWSRGRHNPWCATDDKELQRCLCLRRKRGHRSHRGSRLADHHVL